MTKSAPPKAEPDFSLVCGGLLFRCCRRTRLCGDALERMHREVFVIVGLAWVPLLLFTVLAGDAAGGAINIPFLHDIEAHVRFLIALPVLLAADVIVHRRLHPLVRRFVEREIVVPEEMPQFYRAIESTLRVRNSPVMEGALLVLVYTLGLLIWRSQIAHGGASWYAAPDRTQMNLTLAGYWYVFVSLPIFQFILVRWYVRFFLWFWFLWRVSRLNLRIVPSHPDRSGGLGFLGKTTYAFGPILFAQGAMLAALIAGRIFHSGQHLTAFRSEMAGFLIFFIVIILTPLTVFTPQLSRAKRQGSGDFGALASRYARKFEEKWLRRDASTDDALLGSGDIQSLADLGNSYTVVQEMSVVPFGLKDVTRLIAIAAIPLLPLTLTIFSLEDLLSHVFKALF